LRFFILGDNYGSNPSHYYSLARHLRPLNYDFGTADFIWSRVLDDVEPDVGASIDPSDIRTIQLFVSKSERKE
jgi:hypothetical protein